MKAIYYEKFQVTRRITQVADPQVSPYSVVIRVMATGLCRSDWHGWMGHDPDIVPPHVPGHEFAGEIVEIGEEVEKWSLGDRVTSPFIQACGHCNWCLSGNHQVCKNQEQAGFTRWGSFAEYVEVPHADINLVNIPNQFSFAEAAILGCRFGTAFRALVDQGKIKPGHKIAIFGCGGLGASAVQIAKAIGAEVVGLDIQISALSWVKRLGADITFNLKDPLWKKELLAWSTEGVDITIDAVGASSIIESGLSILKRRGKHIQVGLMPASLGQPVLPMHKVIAHELELIGSHGIQAFRYRDMFTFLEKSNIALKELITREVDLEGAIPLFTKMNENKNSGVIIIRP